MAIHPDMNRLDELASGSTVVGRGKIWVLDMLKFEPGNGRELYRKYLNMLNSKLATNGGKVIFRLYSHVRTVIDGAGRVPEWDGLSIIEYPSPQMYKETLTSAAYKDANSCRESALQVSEIHAMKACWYESDTAEKAESVKVKQVNLDTDMTEVYKLAAEKQKDEKKMEAILGEPIRFMNFISDESFSNGRLWMLNFLKLEEGERANYYYEYAARAQKKIAGTNNADSQDSGNGLKLLSPAVFSLSSSSLVQYNNIAIMQYRDKQAFLDYVSGANSSDDSGAEQTKPETDKTMKDGFTLRVAGLAAQGLVGLLVDSDPSSIADPAGPKLSKL